MGRVLALDLSDKLTAKCLAGVSQIVLPSSAITQVPHPAHTLGSWGVEETGAGAEKRGREKRRINPCLAFGFFPPAWVSSGVVVSFSCFRCANSHLLQCRCSSSSSSMFPLAVTLCHPQTSTLSPLVRLNRIHYMIPELNPGSRAAFNTCKPL